MQPLRIFLFGAPRIEQLDKIVPISRRKVVSLLAYLAVTNQPQSRESLAALFWPEHDQSGARANLRRDLSRLRDVLGEAALTINRSQVALADDFDFWLDVAVFRDALSALRAHAHSPEQLCPDCLASLTEAAVLYGADFLAGFSLPDCPEFDEWLFFEAEGLRAALAEMLQTLIAWHTAQAAYAPAIEYGRRWLSLDTLHEPAHRTLMQLYAWDGQQAAALRQYQECGRILAEELDVAPEAETDALYEQIKSRQLALPQAAAKVAPEAGPPLPPQVVVLPPHERYVIERPLASGGHGQLFLGCDRLTDDPVVIKRLKREIVAQDPSFIERFAQEGEMLCQLNHPNIVRMLATFEHDGERSIVMEYVPDGSLRQRLDAPEPLPLNEALTIGLELADALSRAHHLGILHRDIKPDNVLLVADGTPRLTDFGTARLVRPDVRLTPTGAWLGSPAYMSPEALLGHDLDMRSDIWSLGVMLYEMLGGQRPFSGDQIGAILISIINEPLQNLSKLNPDVPPALDTLLQQMMAKEPEQRPASMRQVAAALEAIRSGQDVVNVTPVAPAHGPDTTTADPSLQAAAPAAAATPPGATPHNLTPPLTPFVGRQAELAQLQKLLTAPDGRLVTVVGLGGMGKSRLALEAAQQVVAMAERPFPHGTFFVSLVGVTTASAVPAAIADALHLTLTGSGSPVVQIVNFLASKSLLLLLDNFEHLLDDAAQADVAIGLVTAVLAGCPGVKLLVTSREPLQLEAEWRLPLDGLSYARDEAAAIDAYGATQLFVQTAVHVQPNFVLMPELVPTLRRVCQLTAGIPLALKLAATWLRAVPLAQIAAEMEKSLDILATNMRDVPARQRSMRAVFDYTWQLLTPPEQVAFRGVAVFCGGFTAEAAQTVAQVSPFVLAGLVDRGLLQTQAASIETGGGTAARYEIHELARQYAAQQATEAEYAALADAHARFFANFAWQRHKTIQQRDYQTAIDELAVEQNNVTTAWYWLLTRLDDPAYPAAELLGQMAYTLKHFYYNRGPLHSAQQLYLEAVDRMQAAGWDTEAGDEAAVARRLALARMQVRAAFFSFGISDYETADRLLQPALAWLRHQQVVDERGLAHSVLAKCYVLRGERKLAEEQTREAMALLEQTDELYEYADALKVLGIVAVDDGRYDEGMACYEQALALHRQEGFLPGIQQMLHNMGTTHFRQGHYEPALQFYREAFAAAEQGGIRRGIMHTGDALGGVNRILGNFQESVAYHKRAIALARELGEQRWLAATLNNMGQSYVWMGKVKAAVGYLQEGLALAWETENVPDALAGLTYLAEAWARQGHVLPAFGLAFFLVDQPQIRANVKKTASDLLEELQNELPPAAAAAAQKWAAAYDLPAVVAAARSGPPVIQISSTAHPA
ncbi:MAG: protein kinase [Anaerolineaceae bacterium]|nr:protein kinase [Anaerolineaceae bacterium]